MEFTWEQVFAWRLGRHHLARDGRHPAADVARRVCGLQAQVASCAEEAVAVRSPEPVPGSVAAALEGRALVKTWAMRGTLHALPADLAADCLGTAPT